MKGGEDFACGVRDLIAELVLTNCDEVTPLTIQGMIDRKFGPASIAVRWLLLPLHHLCGFLACYGVIESFWGFSGRFTYYRCNLALSLNHLTPLYAGP